MMAVSIIAIVSVAIIVAFIITKFAKLSGFIEVKQSAEYKDTFNDLAASVVNNEIKVIVNDSKDKKELTESISRVLNHEIKKTVDRTQKLFSEKYDKIIKEKEKAEEVAVNKYKKTLTQKKQTENIMRSLAEGLVVVDNKGKVLLMNPAAEKILDVEKKKKLKKSIFSDIKDNQVISMVHGTPEAKESYIELASNKDDTRKIIKASSAVIENENGQTVGMVSVLSDITKQKELDRMKANFVNTVTHEFRTPIVTIQKALCIMLEKSAGPISAAQEKFINMALRNLERLHHLIDNLLDLSKLENNKMELKISAASIEDIINDAYETIETWADSKSIYLSKNIQPDMPNINVDTEKIIQALNNLLSNAIKFTPNKGMVNVEAKITEDGNFVQVSIIDNGVGIPFEAMDKIFDKFYQISEKTSEDVKGTGLGLPIVKEIIELHKGKIWLESQPGSGSRFNFTLPLNT